MRFPCFCSTSGRARSPNGSEDHIPDDRLRLVFTCCHPALAETSQVALTLRLLCGLTTAEVARAFLVSESTMAARITRAKHKIAAAGIAYRVPPPEELPARVDAVLTVIHLVFTTGHTAPAGADLMRRDLVERALDLARMLAALLPDDPGVSACSRSSCSPTPDARPGWGRTAACSCSPTRTERSGTRRRSGRAPSWCGGPFDTGRRAGSR